MTDSGMSCVMFPAMQRVSKIYGFRFIYFLQFLSFPYIRTCTVYVVCMNCVNWVCNVSCVKEMCDMTCVYVRTM